jgi:chromosome segregation ATPase
MEAQNKEMEELRQKVYSLKEENRTYYEAIDSLKREFLDYKQTADEEREKANLKVENLKKTLRDSEKEQSKETESLLTRIAVLAEENNNLNSKIKEADEDYRELESDLVDIEKKVREQSDENEELQNVITMLQKEKDRYIENNKQLNSQITQFSAKDEERIKLQIKEQDYLARVLTLITLFIFLDQDFRNSIPRNERFECRSRKEKQVFSLRYQIRNQ